MSPVLEKIWSGHKPPSKIVETVDQGNGKNQPYKENKLDDLIDEDIQKDMTQAPSKLEVFRLRTLKFMASSWFGHIYTNFFLVVSIFSCGQYIYQTYLIDDQHVRILFPSPLSLLLQQLRVALTYVEIALAILFLFDWCLSLFLAEQRWDHFFRFLSPLLPPSLPPWLILSTTVSLQ
jgi:hypothetical protein